jgi:glycerate kinase
MRIVIAPDSFKECAPAGVVAQAIARGVRRAMPEAEVVTVPMADGGEGTVDALVSATGGTLVEREVTGPLGEPVRAAYGILGNGSTAVIEMAAASGLELVPVNRRDPRIATTRGTGELIRDALDHGVGRIIVGIGGSATNDAGAGMAQALGYRLLDADGKELEPGGSALARLDHIDGAERRRGLDTCQVLVACDVSNPLCGPNGASLVYGPQKGATPEVAAELDAALRHFGGVVEAQLGVRVYDVPGAGAAGGLGAGLIAFANGVPRPGVEIVAEACGLRERIAGADLVITGEGRLDGQSAQGKTPVGVARIATECGVPVIAVAGALGPGYEAVYDRGIDAAFSICKGPMSIEFAMNHVEELLEAAAEAIARTWLRARRLP